MNLPPGVVTCGHCGGQCRRSNKHHYIAAGMEGIPLICTRTLVGERFLPSCSDACAKALQEISKSTHRAVKS